MFRQSDIADGERSGSSSAGVDWRARNRNRQREGKDRSAERCGCCVASSNDGDDMTLDDWRTGHKGNEARRREQLMSKKSCLRTSGFGRGARVGCCIVDNTGRHTRPRS